MSFNGEFLKIARQARGLSQKELSVKVGMKQGILSKYENEILPPTDSALKKIAKILDFPIDFFFQEKGHFAYGLAFNTGSKKHY